MMARSNQTADWANRLSPSLGEIESLAIEAYAHLPETFRALCGDITIQVSEFPDDQIIEDMGLESPFDLLGLFEGTGIGERFSLQTGEQPNRITIYRRAVLDYWAAYEAALGDIVAHILIHEIGHHFGLSDEDMERIEASVE
jgi:predicted Zn-dependent protease with MMP-like domain